MNLAYSLSDAIGMEAVKYTSLNVQMRGASSFRSDEMREDTVAQSSLQYQRTDGVNTGRNGGSGTGIRLHISYCRQWHSAMNARTS